MVYQARFVNIHDDEPVVCICVYIYIYIHIEVFSGEGSPAMFEYIKSTKSDLTVGGPEETSSINRTAGETICMPEYHWTILV